MNASQDTGDGSQRGTPAEVFLVFLRLGLVSFGGPIAHLGYFRDAFVERRHWLDDRAYGDLVALCQFLPGPASSQVGFALGWMRAGPLGGLAAWVAFTLPSALLMVAFALGLGILSGPIGQAALHGLKIVAVAVVAQAVWAMARSLTPDRPRAGIAILSALVLVLVEAPLIQLGVIIAGATAGWLLSLAPASDPPTDRPPISRVGTAAALGAFLLLMIGLPLLAPAAPLLDLASRFWGAGALVFGGGHVVLPLLERSIVAPGLVTDADFLAGYGAAQALPGPLFAFAAYLGMVSQGPLGAAVALAGLFLPGLLLVIAALPYWTSLRQRAGLRSAMAGANAAVVGLLGADLYTPLWTGTIAGPQDFALALGALGLLMVGRLPPLAVVAITVAGSVVLAF